MRVRPILIAVLPLTACAPPVERAPVDRVPAARVVGAAVSCLSANQISDSHVRDDRTIDFRVTGGRTYRNTLPYSCPELGFEQRFAYTLHTSQLCSSDIITVLHTGGEMRGASCGLGQFVPVEIEGGR
jgi:hypothetical protein